MVVFPIPAFTDNYIWCLCTQIQDRCVVVDPGDGDAVIKVLDARKMSLQAILLTHHHQDHVGGVKTLLQRFPDIPVYGPEGVCSELTQVVVEGSEVKLTDIGDFTVMHLPGHTLDHIAYYGEQSLFCADVLFSAGCGRVFEGSLSQMYQSLCRIRALPEQTLIYPAHEYTQGNLVFAKRLQPELMALDRRIEEVAQLRAKGLPTVPVSLRVELATNPFLRCDQTEVRLAAKQYVGHEIDQAVEVFAAIRSWKDSI